MLVADPHLLPALSFRTLVVGQHHDSPEHFRHRMKGARLMEASAGSQHTRDSGGFSDSLQRVLAEVLQYEDPGDQPPASVRVSVQF